MNSQLLKQRWAEAKPLLLQRWPQLNADDLLAIDGDFAYLVGALVERCGHTHDSAERQAHVFVARLGADAGETAVLFANARETLAPGARKVREGFEELGAGVRDLAREAAQMGSEKVSEQTAEAAQKARAAAAKAADQGRAMLDRTEDFIRERPFTSLGIAFVAGYLLLGRR